MIVSLSVYALCSISFGNAYIQAMFTGDSIRRIVLFPQRSDPLIAMKYFFFNYKFFLSYHFV